MADSTEDSPTATDAAASAAETEDEKSLAALLGQLLRDGVVGAVAGAAGNVVLFGTLLIAAALGGFDFDSLSLTADLLGLGAVLGPERLLLAGAAVFVLGGLTAWPLILATLGWYLPGESYAAKGLVFGAVLWTGFVVGYYAGYAGVGLGVYLALTLLAHLGYGFATGAAMDRLFGEDNPPLIAQSLREGQAVTAGATPGQTGATDAGGPDAARERHSAGTSGDSGVGSAEGDATGATIDEQVGTADGESVAGVVQASAGAVALAGLDEHAQGVPPLLRFKEAISKIDAELDEDVPPQFTEFKREYLALARSDGTPYSRVSDLRSHLTAMQDTLPATDTVDRWIASMETRLDQYMRTDDTSETLHISGITFSEDGDPVDSITALQEELATVQVTVTNQGSRSGAVVHLEFRRQDPADPEGSILLRSDDLSMGYIEPGGRETLETKVYVPSIAEWYEATVLDPAADQTFLTDVDEVRES